jgi:hypothetical protein
MQPRERKELSLVLFFQLALYTLVALFFQQHVLFYQTAAAAAAAAAFH